jgi:hypothetical protein
MRFSFSRFLFHVQFLCLGLLSIIAALMLPIGWGMVDATGQTKKLNDSYVFQGSP